MFIRVEQLLLPINFLLQRRHRNQKTVLKITTVQIPTIQSGELIFKTPAVIIAQTEYAFYEMQYSHVI